MMNKRQARRNLLLAGLLIAASAIVTGSALAYIRFFMNLPR
jgi:hypothetical protein